MTTSTSTDPGLVLSPNVFSTLADLVQVRRASSALVRTAPRVFTPSRNHRPGPRRGKRHGTPSSVWKNRWPTAIGLTFHSFGPVRPGSSDPRGTAFGFRDRRLPYDDWAQAPHFDTMQLARIRAALDAQRQIRAILGSGAFAAVYDQLNHPSDPSTAFGSPRPPTLRLPATATGRAVVELRLQGAETR
ncbi:hypothetical protein GCM10023205_79650 [Yinghuangia aomiensis]|uniref:Uncharacterized protein n=1 Tax=Yinghuangia aomiensis TaxID=676205 RepID=A0ABP9ICM1_9ACTN